MFNGKNTSGGIDAIPKIHILFLTQKVVGIGKLRNIKAQQSAKKSSEMR